MNPDVGPVEAEEPWESEIGDLLGGLPPVSPPVGFIDAAIDHRPLYAGRVLASLVGATVVVLALVAATGVAGRQAIVPPIDELVARHDVAAVAGVSDSTPDDRTGPATLADRASPVELPEGFEAAATLQVEDVRQAIYGRGDESVSVFVQEGRADWSALPADRLTDLGGLPAWVDPERSVAVIEVDGSTVTVIGLAPAELEQAVVSGESASESWSDRATELAEALVVPFGYAPAG